MEKQVLITVSREFGSGGHEVAAELAKRFGLPLYDESILDSIAHKHNLKLDKLSRFDESPINIFTSRRVRGFSNSPEEHVSAMQAHFLQQKAQAGESFVVLGRCGEEYLRNFPGLLSIFVLAAREFKQQRTMRIDKVSAEEALELMRDSCTTIRDLALIDLLASSGMRVGELVALNRDDINFNERECVVFGKGDKERLAYFDARTKIHLQNYLNSRSDDNPALFVSLVSPHRRLMICGVETRLREMGRRLNIPKVHPHKFRRTLATSAIDKGMPIEQVQQLLGHQKIDTTMHYAMVKQQNVKSAHRKYIG